MLKNIPRKSIEYFINEKGCHVCTSHKTVAGNYPSLTIKGKTYKISRLIFELFHRPIPKGYLIRHTCDNRMCINPYHLQLGTNYDNVRDMMKRGRHKPALGEDNGNSKLKSADVKNIFNSPLPNQQLAHMYRVHISTIRGIKNGKQWKSVTKIK